MNFILLFSSVIDANFSCMLSATWAVAKLFCFWKVSITPLLPSTEAYTSSELSVTNTSATSESLTGSMPSILRSKSTRFFNISAPSSLSPIFTRYWEPSLSFIYPAGIEKFCAFKMFEIISTVSVPLTSALSRAELTVSSHLSSCSLIFDSPSFMASRPSLISLPFSFRVFSSSDSFSFI